MHKDYVSMIQFQSTLPGRGATSAHLSDIANAVGFNPRSPGGERLIDDKPVIKDAKVSIHAPRAGSDLLEQSL